MPVTIPQTETILKSYFETGDQPTQDQFAEFIGTMFYLTQLAIDTANAALAAVDGVVQIKAFAKATTNGVNAYTIEPGDFNVSTIQVFDDGSLTVRVRVTWDTPFLVDDYIVLTSPYSGVSPRKNNVLMVSQTTDYVELRFSRESPSVIADYGVPSFHIIAIEPEA